MKPLKPLRKVVATWEEDWRGAMEELECGHIIRREDRTGPTNAHRRRCQHCVDGTPAYIPELHDIRCGCPRCKSGKREHPRAVTAR